MVPVITKKSKKATSGTNDRKTRPAKEAKSTNANDSSSRQGDGAASSSEAVRTSHDEPEQGSTHEADDDDVAPRGFQTPESDEFRNVWGSDDHPR